MKKLLCYTVLAFLTISSTAFCQKKNGPSQSQTLTLSADELKDKIKGGWAAQTIGVTFGGPTEFKYNGTFIQDYQPIVWYDGYLKKTMEEIPGLYDDIYMDLTFVDILERVGLDAPVDSFSQAFAYAKYDLWHANQSARYNIMNGIKAPETGHWKYNPHADDIDFQIEADFSGLMSPGMPNTAIQIGDKIGHIMNYGDGWYGGAYVGAMYSLAFTSRDVNYVVTEALKTIPPQSQFYQCIADVIKWHKQYPNDWKQNWMEIQKKWSEDIGCPDGVFSAFNIDARTNAAYIVLGLLYGKGDFDKTLQISTRAGQDSDCNPSSAGGILGTMLGYNQIPAYWKMGLKEIEDMPFKYTTMSLNNVYAISYKHALEMVKRNGGSVTDNSIKIALQSPKTVRFEKSFEGLFPIAKVPFNKGTGKNEFTFDFTGTGFVLRGMAAKLKKESSDYILEADLFIDDQKVETAKLPTSSLSRRNDIFWKYELPNKKHTVKVVVKNPDPEHELRTWDYLIYSDKPFDGSIARTE
ncbi:ADP-ribosylglycohydrolase family protein [Dyadobacter sp. NIV53]|uniref:ADP-ribosylglycohydrolase family protein n=1 Tax=Dyadobacter sp. NIV53 TaxID=2861765 RepID=UPI001C87DA6C|nr:ADP-ribosylglycohydrolase family protein [Dyadobacter sp. NIV53]